MTHLCKFLGVTKTLINFIEFYLDQSLPTWRACSTDGHGNILVAHRQDLHPWAYYFKGYKAIHKGEHQDFRNA